jgi:ribosomal protein L11 methyltransferase
MSYWIVEIQCPQENAEHLSWLWAQNLETAVELQDHDTHPELEEGKAKVIARLEKAPDEEWLHIAKQAVIEAECDAYAIQSRFEADDSWQLGWKAFFKPTIICDALGVRPPWEESNPSLPLEIIIEPGLAFGVGTHATTQLAAKLAAKYLSQVERQTVIDMGCGSGILAIACAKWGHETVGVEIDEIAIENAKENGEINGVDVSWICDANFPEARVFDVSIINIIAPVLIQLAAQALVHTQKYIILSGMLVEQEETVLRFYLKNQWQIKERMVTDGWVGLILEKK